MVVMFVVCSSQPPPSRPSAQRQILALPKHRPLHKVQEEVFRQRVCLPVGTLTHPPAKKKVFHGFRILSIRGNGMQWPIATRFWIEPSHLKDCSSDSSGVCVCHCFFFRLSFVALWMAVKRLIAANPRHMGIMTMS